VQEKASKQACAPNIVYMHDRPAASEGAPVSAGPLDVLVVDDNAAAAQTLGWMLELFGHRVHIAHEGGAALALAGSVQPHLVLMDLGLPGMSGYELCRRMRTLPGLEHTVFAAQTGWDSQQHRTLSKEAGFEYHLVKPIEIEALRGLLASAEKIQALVSRAEPRTGM
jgi:CheY-like chemotaxis protein